MIEEELTGKIIACAYEVHKKLGSGFLEKVYENAMVIELKKQSLNIEQQASIKVWYDGQVVGDYSADLFVEEKVVVELKAVQNLIKEHEVQLVNYLTATGINIGLLINFGSSVQVRRKYREFKRAI